MDMFGHIFNELHGLTTHSVWSKVLEVVASLDDYLNTTTHNVQVALLLLGLCSSLAVAFYVYYRARKVLTSRRTERTTLLNLIENAILYIVKWTSLTLSLLLAISVFVLAVWKAVPILLFTVTNAFQPVSISKVFQILYMYHDLSLFLSLLATAGVMIWQKMAVVDHIIFLVRLPFRLMIDPPCALYNNYYSTSRNKAKLSLALYYLFYFLMGVECARLFLDLSPEPMTLRCGMWLFIILFNAASLLSYTLGTAFNKTVTCLSSGCCTDGSRDLATRDWEESTDGGDTSACIIQEEEGPVRTKRYYYHFSYIA